MLKLFSKRKIILLATVVLVLLAVVFLSINATLAQTDIYGVNYSTDVGLSSVDIRVSIVKIVRVILGILGVIALAIILYGGFVWMTSHGDSAQVEKAKKILLNAVIGLIIIFLAFSIVQYIFKVLEDGAAGGSGSSICTANQCYGCMRCNITEDGYWCDDSCGSSCSVGCSSIGPSSELRIEDVQTSHSGASSKDDVYWCSKVQTIYNRNLNPATVVAAITDPPAIGNPLRINTSPANTIADGTWQILGNVTVFTPRNNEFVERNTSYQQHIPTGIEDTAGLFVSNCSLTASCEGPPPPDFRWDFYVGPDGDTQAPKVTDTYPINSGPAYPDTYVNLAPVIDVTFSEDIDASTVIDPASPPNPYPGHIYLYQLDGPGGASVSQVSNSIITVQMKSNGFRFYLDSPNLLQEFTYYRIIIQDIEDLCGNVINPNNFTWEFATSNIVPGVAGYYPAGNNVCSDAGVSITYNTSMYYDLITFSIQSVGNPAPSSYQLDPLNGIETTTANIGSGAIAGEFRVRDPGNISTGYKVFEFISAADRSEERRVGKECRSRWSPYH